MAAAMTDVIAPAYSSGSAPERCSAVRRGPHPCAFPYAPGMDFDLPEELLELQDFTQDIIHSMRGGLLTTDGEGRIVVLNRTGEEILEKTFQELRGVSLKQWNSEFWLPGQMTGQEKAGLRKEIDYKTPSGKQRFLGISVSFLRSRDSGRR